MEKKNEANKSEIAVAAKRGEMVEKSRESCDYDTKVKLYKHKSRQAQ